eukprot:gene4099-8154_t
MASFANSSIPQNVSKQQLDENLFCYITRIAKPLSFTFEIECTGFMVVHFVIDFTGSVNLSGSNLDDPNNLLFKKDIGPFSKDIVCTIGVKDPSIAASMKTSKTWTVEDPPEKELKAYINQQESERKRLLTVLRKLRIDEGTDSTAEIILRCNREAVQFLDSSFVADDAALYMSSSGHVIPPRGRRICWRRPTEYLKGSFEVFDGLIEPGDIKQGALGDCWFLCALASLAEFPPLVRVGLIAIMRPSSITCYSSEVNSSLPSLSLTHRLFVRGSDVPNETGVYRLRLCKNGTWREVVVDDLFPCLLSGGPIYSRCHDNEIWVQLVEKAYAKVHGSYNLIRNGQAYEAMIDLTGAPFEKLYFDDAAVIEQIKNGSLFRKLQEYDEQGDLMSVSTPGEDRLTEGEAQRVTLTAEGKLGTGLIAGHAYSLITVVAPITGPPGLKLVQIRNPWGSHEWTGDWSDRSPLWTTSLRAEVGARIDDDGSFWMTFEDMVKHFDSLNVCNCRAGVRPWIEQRKKAVGGRVTVSMFELQIKDRGVYYVSVHQADERIAKSSQYIDIGVAVLRLKGPGGDMVGAELINAAAIVPERQVQLKLELTPGHYVIVPTTSGCRFQHFLEKQTAASQSEPFSPPMILFLDPSRPSYTSFTHAASVAIEEVFCRFDQDMDGQWSRLLQSCGSRRGVGGLRVTGFKEAILKLYEMEGKVATQEMLWTDLERLGYDRRLLLLLSRTVTVAVHSDFAVDIRPCHFVEKVFEEAMEQPIKRWGNKQDIATDGSVKLYTRKGGYTGVSFAVENLTTKPIWFEQDCSQSRNTLSHRGDLKAKTMVSPGDLVVTHHLMSRDQTGWAWTYTACLEM